MWATHSNRIQQNVPFATDRLSCLTVPDDFKAEWKTKNCTEKLPFICALEQDRVKLDQRETNFLSAGAFAQLTHKVLDHDNKHFIEIELEFSTTERNGMLLWQGEREDNVFICIGIVNGRLFVDIAERKAVRSSIEVSDGKVHTINLIKYSDKYQIAADGEAVENVTLSEDFVFNHARPVYLGGLPVSEGSISDKTGGLFEKGFVGCIHRAGFHTHCKPESENCSPYFSNPVDFTDHTVVIKLYNSEVGEQCSTNLAENTGAQEPQTPKPEPDPEPRTRRKNSPDDINGNGAHYNRKTKAKSTGA